MNQWYEKNKALYEAEVKLMKSRFPDAKQGFLQSNGNMYWIVRMKLSESDAFEPWTFMLVYLHDHPHNNTEGGSIKVIPLNPTPEEMMKRVKDAKGKYNLPNLTVPHLLLNREQNIIYLCTRAPKDIATGEEYVTSAVTVAAWAAEWALYFELSMRSNDIWNKWVNTDKYKRLLIK